MTPCHQNFTKVPSIPDANRHSPHLHRRGSVYLAWHRWQRSWYCGWLQRIIPGTGTHFRPRKGGGNKGGFTIWEVDWVYEWWRILVWNLKSWPTKICLLLVGVLIVTIVNHPPRLTRTFPAIFQLRGPAEASDVRISSKKMFQSLGIHPPLGVFCCSIGDTPWIVCAPPRRSHPTELRHGSPRHHPSRWSSFLSGWVDWAGWWILVGYLSWCLSGKRNPTPKTKKIHSTPASHVASLES